MHGPCEGCTQTSKVEIILVGSGEHHMHDPCEGCTQKLNVAILAGSGEHHMHDPYESCMFFKLF